MRNTLLKRKKTALLVEEIVRDLENLKIRKGMKFDYLKKFRNQKIAHWKGIQKQEPFDLPEEELKLLVKLIDLFTLYKKIDSNWRNYISLLCIEGCVGAGKSTLVPVLSKRYRIPRLKAVCRNKRMKLSILGTEPEKIANSFLAQLSYQVFKIEALFREMLNITVPHMIKKSPFFTIITDRWKPGYYPFIRILKKTGRITLREFRLLEKIDLLFSDKFPQRVFVILLVADVNTLLKRIKARGDIYDHTFSKKDLNEIQQLSIDTTKRLKIPPPFCKLLDTTQLSKAEVYRTTSQLIERWGLVHKKKKLP